MFSNEISEDDVSVYEEFRNQLEEQTEERNFNQGQIEIPPKK
jgi:hypothetical protein